MFLFRSTRANREYAVVKGRKKKKKQKGTDEKKKHRVLDRYRDLCLPLDPSRDHSRVCVSIDSTNDSNTIFLRKEQRAIRPEPSRDAYGRIREKISHDCKEESRESSAARDDKDAREHKDSILGQTLNEIQRDDASSKVTNGRMIEAESHPSSRVYFVRARELMTIGRARVSGDNLERDNSRRDGSRAAEPIVARVVGSFTSLRVSLLNNT